MTKPAAGNGGRATGADRYGASLARQIDVDYIRDAAARNQLNRQEAVGLGWALWGVTYAKAHALQPADRARLERLRAAIDAGRFGLSIYAQRKAREVLQLALDGDLDARLRMLRYADGEGVK